MLTQLPLTLYLSVVSLLGLYALSKTSALFSKIKRKRLKWIRKRSLETLAAENRVISALRVEWGVEPHLLNVDQARG
jgi:hypothetical protein